MNATLMQANGGKYSSDEERWTAVMNRDRNADGHFYYSVRTTGIYCRPGCPSRLAKRENVGFHASCAAAERAGFRACERCRPNAAGLVAQHAAAVAKACRLIETAADMPNLEQLAKAAGMSQFHFHRVFKSITGITPRVYASACRARQVRDRLGKGGTVTEAIYDAGYNSGGRFYGQSNELLGMTPTQFRSGGSELAIHHAAGECSLGAILVAATDKGICAILLGDDPKLLLQDLKNQFPQAQLTEGDAAFETWIAKVIAFVETPKTGLDLPLDIRGTAFQQRVWQALREMPAGSKTSYSELASRIGRPKAVRAVASACASNTIAVAIPCHRVVRSDGTLSGYRWGVARKRALLEREGEQ